MKILFQMDNPHFRFRTDLEGYEFSFYFKYDFAGQLYFVDIDCDELDFHKKGAAVLTSVNMFKGHALPVGVVMILDFQGEVQEEPVMEQFGDRWKLVHLTEEEAAGAY